MDQENRQPPSNATLLSPAPGVLVSLADLWTIAAAVVAAPGAIPAGHHEAYMAAVARVRAALDGWKPQEQ
jgi:hypothetical protein